MSTLSPEVVKRQKIERRIARRLILDGKKAGYSFNVDNGGEDYELKEPTDNVKLLLDTLFATDEEHLFFFKDGKRVGWVFLVYGNDGWDVICDYTVNLEHIMEGANKVSDRAQGC